MANEPLILFPHPPAAHAENIMQIFADAGLAPQIVQTVEEMHTALGLLAAGIGVTLVPSAMQKTQREGSCLCQSGKANVFIRIENEYREDDTLPVLSRFIETVHSIKILVCIPKTRYKLVTTLMDNFHKVKARFFAIILEQ